MVIQFNPRISGAFVKVIAESKSVQEALRNVDSESERHEIIKSVLIQGFTKYRININDLINHIKEPSDH